VLLGLVIAHGLLTFAGAELRTASTEGGGCIMAVSLSPLAASGDAQIFEARYAHCEGAAAFRVVQLWIGDEVTPSTPRVNLGFEDGMFSLEDGGACAPGDPVVLESTYGALDCATSTITQSADEVIAVWSLSFDTATFAGSHGIFFDAKGGTGEPEPRLEWTLMGTYTVEAAAGSTGNADESGTTQPDPSTTDAAPGDSSGTTDAGATDEGGLPGAAPRRRGAQGCTCTSAAGSSSALLGLVALCLRRRRRRGR
jgi:hypothetical protein